MVYDCEKIAEAGFEIHCCVSCHEDFGMGYDEPFERYQQDDNPFKPQKSWAAICCRIASQINFDNPEFWDRMHKWEKKQEEQP